MVGCTKRKLGEQRARFLKDYRAAVGGGNFDVGVVVHIMKSRMQWKVRGDFVVVGEEERPEVECILFGFVPCWQSAAETAVEYPLAKRLQFDMGV